MNKSVHEFPEQMHTAKQSPPFLPGVPRTFGNFDGRSSTSAYVCPSIIFRGEIGSWQIGSMSENSVWHVSCHVRQGSIAAMSGGVLLEDLRSYSVEPSVFLLHSLVETCPEVS